MPFLHYVLIFIGSAVLVGCGGHAKVESPTSYSFAEPFRMESSEVIVILLGAAGRGDQGTLVRGPGWREYFLQIENLSSSGIVIENIKLLNQQGRYLDSAVRYEQIQTPPSAGSEVAGDVAETAAGIAVGQVIPYGGTILGVFTGAASSSSAEAEGRVRQAFDLRLLNAVELAPLGKVLGSAFLPDVDQPRRVAVDFAKDGKTHRLEITLPPSA